MFNPFDDEDKAILFAVKNIDKLEQLNHMPR